MMSMALGISMKLLYSIRMSSLVSNDQVTICSYTVSVCNQPSRSTQHPTLSQVKPIKCTIKSTEVSNTNASDLDADNFLIFPEVSLQAAFTAVNYLAPLLTKYLD